MFISTTPPVKHTVPGGELSTIHNGRFWETIFFASGHEPDRMIHDLHGPEDAKAFAAKLNEIPVDTARTILRAYGQAS